MKKPLRNEVALADILAAMRAWRWRIAAIITFTVTCGGVYLLVAPKVYRADALLQLDKPEPDRAASRPGDLKALAAQFEKQTNSAAEMAVIRSRTILGSVVDELRLDIISQPLRLPSVAQLRSAGPADIVPLLVGGLTRHGDPAAPHAPVIDLSVPDELLDKPLTLLWGNAGEFSLLDADGQLLARGRAGTPLDARLGDGSLHILVEPSRAMPGARYSIMRRSRVAAIHDLEQRIKVAEEGEHSGVIRLTLEGEDRALTRETVRAIVRSYQDIHARWRSQDVTEALAYLQQQVPQMEDQAKKAQTALSQFQEANGSMNLGADDRHLLDRITQLETEMARRQRDMDNYTPAHPAYVQIQAETARLKQQIAELQSRINLLPRRQERAVELARSANLTSDLYAQLLRNVQELQLIKAAIANEIRVVDPGDVLPRPVKPASGLVLAISLLVGLCFATAGALIQHLRRGVSDHPDDIEDLLGLPVYATLPFVPHQRSIELERVHKVPELPFVLAFQAPTEMAVEGLRGLRTWLNTGDFRRAQKGLLITGPTQSVGKTFVTTNLAALLAAAGRRVLLIDADMRKGNAERPLKIKSSPGLSDLLSGKASDMLAVARSVGGFHCIPKGSPTPHCTELLMNGRFEQLLTLAYANFDDVIIDSPPILAVSDAVIIGQLVGSALLVARANVNTAAELLESKKRLAQAEIPLKGVVFNGVEEAQLARYGYQYAYPAESP